ncbi:hypothetical protein [Niveibacterium umoris]|uniref:Choline-glycine betaine transporter n=1 Tax=Niveibacterium umoris TaxID=1193620 RepID=A0A840BH43_9RHOO|nr:hypothetical protein [Niveibacterium umoris]MBB4012290.1 choline-glycine betaine transporter [Niveibacterium umoris]
MSIVPDLPCVLVLTGFCVATWRALSEEADAQASRERELQRRLRVLAES